MKARDLLGDIASEFGLNIVECYDTDYDIILREGKVPRGLKGKLKKYGYRYMEPVEEETGEITMHIHAPMRKKKSWFDRGWDWEVPGTPGELPGEGPLTFGSYLGESPFGEN